MNWRTIFSNACVTIPLQEGSFVVNGTRYSIKPAPVRLSELSRVLKKRLIHSGAKGHLHEIQQLTSVGQCGWKLSAAGSVQYARLDVSKRLYGVRMQSDAICMASFSFF